MRRLLLGLIFFLALATAALARFSDDMYTVDRGMIKFCPGGADRANQANWQVLLFGFDRDPSRQLQIPDPPVPGPGSQWVAFSYRTINGDGLAAVRRDSHALRVLRPAQTGRLTDLSWTGPTTLRYRYHTAGGISSESVSLSHSSRSDPMITWLVERHRAVCDAMAILNEIRRQPTTTARQQRFDHYAYPGLCSLARQEYQALINAPGPLQVDLQEFGRNSAGSEVAILVFSVDNRHRVGQIPDGNWYYLRWNVRLRKFEQAVLQMGRQPHAGHDNDGETFGQELTNL